MFFYSNLEQCFCKLIRKCNFSNYLWHEAYCAMQLTIRLYFFSIKPVCIYIYIYIYMKEGKLFETSGGRFVAADVLTASAADINTNDAKYVAVTSA